MQSRTKHAFKKQRVLVFCCVGAIVTLAAWNVLAQDAASPSKQDKVQQSIRNALQGESETASADEPLLQDVLDLIKRQGSVLDGSMLDEADEAHVESVRQVDHEAGFRAAEALLRAARLLNDLPSTTNPERKPLIRQMRQQAMTLLQSACNSEETPAKFHQ
ncbi:MAG: hypothetical protein R3C05_20505 [Pirellulaceae bacterium]